MNIEEIINKCKFMYSIPHKYRFKGGTIMLDLKGKYNECRVFTELIDKETISQLNNLLNQECIKDSQIRIMPDCHAGKGCVIGTTMTLKDKVIPNLVGVDIGCGMVAVKLKENRIDLPNLDSVVRKYVPSGMTINVESKEDKTSLNLTELKCYGKAAIKDDYIYRSVGTLGGGNHFIEIDKDEEGHLWLVVHTGSRNLGKIVCEYYQDLGYKTLQAESNNGTREEKLKILIEQLKKDGRHKEIQKKVDEFNKNYKENKCSVPYELAYVHGDNFNDYIHDMRLVQGYARDNRAEIVRTILKYAKLHEVEQFDTIHNYIDTDNMILRKGSISAQLGERVLIPMNMRDGSLICIGKGNSDWNYSAPHGAGRILSRSKAKESISMKDYRESMTGIYTSCVNNSTLDESAFAYKPMESIVENIKDTVEIQSIIKPIYNFKASE